MSAAPLPERVQARPGPAELSAPVSARILRNAAWLFCSEGITKSLFFFANILLARLLTASNYGVLALAQSWVLYAGLLADLGIMMYGQAEAARRPIGEDTAALAAELMPFRALAGAMVLVGLLALLPVLISSRALRITVAAASLYLVGQAISAEWLFRGKERFEVVMAGNAAGAATFLAAVAVNGSGAGALFRDALAWSLSSLVMAAAYLVFLPRLIGSYRRLRVRTPAWRRHAREASFFALSNIIAESYRVLPFFLLGILASAQEVGLFAAPLRLVVNLASLGFLVPMAFYPASARLFREQPEVFAHSRRALVFAMLAIGAPVAVIGGRLAAPIMTIIFGPRYGASAPIFALLMWTLPLYLVRFVYGTTILATGFQRLHSLASATAAAIGLLAGIPLVHRFGGVGAAWTLICSESAMTAALIAISARVHHEAAIPATAKLVRLASLLIVMWLCGAVSYHSLGPLCTTVVMIAVYLIGLDAVGVADWQKVVRQFLIGGALRARPGQFN